jgi:DNA-binding NtrC family response regulator
MERAMVELALQKAQNNQTQAARLLDISRDALRYKMKKFGLLLAEEDKAAADHPRNEEDFRDRPS